MSHAAYIEMQLIRNEIPAEDASVAAWHMGSIQPENLPASSALPDLIQAFVELYNVDREDAMNMARKIGNDAN